MTSYLMNVYNPAPLSFSRGKGAWLYTAAGEAYLDCVAGVATNALGHAHPVLVEMLKTQADALWHVSNLYRIPEQEALAERLTQSSFADVAFFCNTGTEAVETALKVARKFHAANGQPERVDIIGFDKAFHGRTHAALSAAGNLAYLDGFGPALPGYIHVKLEDETALTAAIASPTAAAVIIEPVQGEGGGRAVPGEYLQRLRRLCDAHGVLLIYDEVQTGMGRTGKLFAHQWFNNAAPDIMALAKALGAGFPVGACLATERASVAMTPGTHGSTFGGNPLAMAVATVAFDLINTPEMATHVSAVAARLWLGLVDLKEDYGDIIFDVRGKGLLIGVQLTPNNREFMAAARDEKLLVAGGGDNCVRLLPPLTLTYDEADIVLLRFKRACAALRAKTDARKVA